MNYIIALLSTISLLTLSNLFMTFAWYGHLKFENYPLYLVVIASWGIAFFEYCFQVPANRIGHTYFSAFELKIMQEIITMSIFILFSYFYLEESIRWNHYIGLLCIMIGSFIVFYKF